MKSRNQSFLLNGQFVQLSNFLLLLICFSVAKKLDPQTKKWIKPPENIYIRFWKYLNILTAYLTMCMHVFGMSITKASNCDIIITRF